MSAMILLQQCQRHCAETKRARFNCRNQPPSRPRQGILVASMLMCVGTAEEQQLVMPEMPNVHTSQADSPPKHVVGFGKMVDVFSSKQRPKKLTIYGDDFR